MARSASKTAWATTVEDGALGRAVGHADEHVDALHDSIFRTLLTYMMSDARIIAPALEFLLVSRNLERVGDLATNIGEHAVYVAEGKQIRHHLDEERSDGQDPGTIATTSIGER